MLSSPISFVDVETSGTNANFSRIIEIGIIRVEKNKVIACLDTLINPQTGIDPFIQDLTGISSHELESAPTFHEVKDDLLEILDGSIFVAHNVRFDYGFIRNEFKRLDISYTCKHFCTVKLARLLYPQWEKYNLDMLIKKFDINVLRRHRALDDAKVLWHFFRRSQKEIKKDRFEKALEIVLKRPTVPINISEKDLDALPESPGVYVFYGDSSIPLYIGKSINIRDRVLSHFSADHLTAKEMALSQQVKSIKTIVTAGELGALLLESKLVKEMKPLYNRLLKGTKELIALKKKVTRDGYYTVTSQLLSQMTIGELSKVIGVFKSPKDMKKSLFQLAKAYSLCAKLLDLEKTGTACFAYQLGGCKGACLGIEMKLKYNLRFDEAFYKLKIKKWPFAGPVQIREKSERMETFIIDKWCVIGNRKSEFDENKSDYLFDYDTYNILNRYFQNPGNLKNISSL